ncbi:4-oxalomesaconate tautomerase [Streptomyces europaeiscabiei]|uniref:4-oxalomesaconate tautomerase n=1 Tax=Streptomyces europaeiscabiei TaxID=146819 RepID=UPI0029BE0A27|nr:4-oxalomesaconate tautomerase [Streptomyces europaeiscabiei]MDX3712389.1 4-oxalomesaconate tautomerase [Streptomyces europaeiscabiei]MDX3843694.1 4-oxalomesaconate tautomerase [Streptomyces europaeiscabiei]MDX3863173.1 4-oxalomesaconate tautomerase [Streptomyces europaeiscabiei]MDX3873227.1 4-oxalomesaconate tautomerase [Streptomyces europaeiscabiei]
MTGWPDGIRCMLMRGGTSKGAYFLAEDLPAGPADRDGLLLRVMGGPDPRQIDGLGGAHPLTSKVAVVSASADPEADVDYLFLQVGVDLAEVSDRQNCGNLLAGVGPFAVERGLVSVGEPETSVRIRMLNSGDLAVATFPTPGGRIAVTGDAGISGVPGTAAPVVIEFPSGGTPLLPTGNARDVVAGTEVTCVDNGMPTVLIPAAALNVTGHETPEILEEDLALADRLRGIRLAAGPLMGLGDAEHTTVPKLSLLAPPQDGGAVATRTFIPVRCHTSIGVLGGASVAAGLRVKGGVGDGPAQLPLTGDLLRIEHPTGFLDIETHVAYGPDGGPSVSRTAVVRTARKIFDGTVFPRPADPASRP